MYSHQMCQISTQPCLKIFVVHFALKLNTGKNTREHSVPKNTLKVNLRYL